MYSDVSNSPEEDFTPFRWSEQAPFLPQRILSLCVTHHMSRCPPVECKILYYLAVHANTVCTFNQIESSVFGYNSNEGAGASIVKSKIRRIRSLIEPDPMHPTYVLTIPEVGYMLVDHVHDETRE
jgi:DNA-binding response OmpR family regulator